MPFLGRFFQPYWQCQKDLKFSMCLYSKRGNQIKLHTTKRGNQVRLLTLFPDLLWKCAIIKKHQFYRKKMKKNKNKKRNDLVFHSYHIFCKMCYGEILQSFFYLTYNFNTIEIWLQRYSQKSGCMYVKTALS